MPQHRPWNPHHCGELSSLLRLTDLCPDLKPLYMLYLRILPRWPNCQRWEARPVRENLNHSNNPTDKKRPDARLQKVVALRNVEHTTLTNGATLKRRMLNFACQRHLPRDQIDNFKGGGNCQHLTGSGSRMSFSDSAVKGRDRSVESRTFD